MQFSHSAMERPLKRSVLSLCLLTLLLLVSVSVVRGFTKTGDVIANDPAMGGDTTDAGVEIVYPRAIFQSLWLNASNGTVYVNYPEFWPTPTKDALGSWSPAFL